MSPFRKSDDVLNEWRAVADRAARPARAPRGSFSRSQLPAGMAALAAVLVVAAIIGARTFVQTGPASSGSPSTSSTTSPAVSSSVGSSPSGSSATPKASASTVASPQPSAAPAVCGTDFTTGGVTSNWRSFAWSPIADGSPLLQAFSLQVFEWQGLFVARGEVTNADCVWTSPDGLTWTTVFQAPSLVVAPGPNGLVAITNDPVPGAAGQTTWTSSDGLHWANAGATQGIGTVTSLGGTSAGLVAAASIQSGTGKYATSQFEVARSTDGLHWTTTDAEPNLNWDETGPRVQAGNGRFFLMGGLKAGSASDESAIRLVSSVQSVPLMWWSDDGKSWHRVSGSTGYFGSEILFARDGMILLSSMGLIPGGTELSLSTDGGKTWQGQGSFSPLGDIVCGQGECSTGPDGVIGSNGSFFLAVKSDGHAWTSYDGKSWTPVAWSGPSQSFGLVVLPRGVVVNGQYGAAK